MISKNRLSKFNLKEAAPRIILEVIALLTVGLLVGIFLFLFSSGFSAIKDIGLKELIFGTTWNPIAYGQPSWGGLPLILGTFWVTIAALVIAIPMGLASAIYISEVASPRLREILKPAIEMIASVPSVVLGLLGLLFLAPLVAKVFHLSNGLNALTAGILVGIATLPTVASICEDALRAVPQKYRQSSLALGATQWTTIKRVVIPAAKSGLLAGLMLGLGRIIGETMIVLMVAGNSSALPHSLLDPVRPMTANIAIEIKETVVGSLHWESLFAIGLGLFVITFVVNFLADLLIHKNEVR